MLQIQRYEERGDAPAQAILQANSQARAIRKAIETQEELERIKERVVRTLDTYDLSEKLSGGHDKAEVDRIAEEYIREQANLEFIDDMAQLMIILSDPVAKRKYQQQVTVFIVGFENLCGRRAKLLAQLQEFFNQNTAEESKFELEPPEVDWDDMNVQVREALGKAEKATERLATVSKDVMKALELANPKETKKGKKKLEKALHQANQDIMSLTEKMLKVQSELDQNENKLSQVYRSMEMKTVEIERLKVQADNAKKYSDEVNELKTELSNKDKEVQGLTKTANELELTVAQLEDKMERDYERNRHLKEESQRIKSEYEEKLRDQQKYVDVVQTEMKQHYDAEVKKLRSEQELTLYYLKQDHETAMKRKERAIETAKKKNEELKSKADLSASESSPRLSHFTDSPIGKLGSPFSPDSSESEAGTQGRVSLKSSAQSIRMMLRKSGTETSVGSPQDSGVQSPVVESPTKMLLRKESIERSKGDLNEQNSKTPDTPKTSDSSKNIKSKSPDTKPGRRSKSPQKTVQINTLEEETNEGKSMENTNIGKHVTQAESATGKVEMIDASVQSDSEDQDVTRPKPILRRTSTLQVVHEHDADLEEDAEVDWANLSPEELLARAELFKAKSLKKIESLNKELSEWKTKYLRKTDSLRREVAEANGKHFEERENLINQLKEAQALKEQAEREAEQAVLQLEEILAEQEEMRLVQEKSLQDRQDEHTMTGVSLRSVRSVENRDTMTGKSLDSKQSLQSDSYHSFVSRGVSPFPIMESSTQEDTVGEEHGADYKPSPRDSGFEGAGSSVRFDSRPESGSDNTSSVLSHRVTKISEPPQVTRSNTLAAPRREVVMSARARRRLISSALRDHPVASETLRTYESVVRFKEDITKWLELQGLFVEMGELTKLEMAAVSKANLAEMIERIPEIRYCISQVLDKVSNIISTQSLVRESTTTTEPIIKTSAESTRYETTDVLPPDDADASEETSSHKKQLDLNYGKLLKEYNDLAEGYETLKKHLEEETKFHQEQTSQNAAIMVDMQETINRLQSQLDDVLAGRSYSRRASSSIMFTRMDAERNGKILKRAINEKRLTDDNVTKVFEQMSDYVSLPAKRLSIIVQRYRHHHAMQQIEEQLRKNGGNLDNKVLQTLQNMERLQNERAKRWGDRMDDIADTRQRLAQLMTETFEKLENDTGIFLIKPVLSYQSRANPTGGYIVSNKKQSPGPPSAVGNGAPSAPAPTPWLSTGKTSAQSLHTRGIKTSPSIPVMTKHEVDINMEINTTHQGQEVYSTQTWEVSKSQSIGSPSVNAAINTPRMLELDVNRMMIGQTQASTGFVASSDNGEVPSSLVRSYVTVERPSGGKKVKKTRQPSISDYSYEAMVPHLRNSPATLRYSPLPPIRMPEVRQDSHASKSLRSYPESEALTQSFPGSPADLERFGQISPSRLAMEDGRTLSPDVVPAH